MRRSSTLRVVRRALLDAGQTLCECCTCHCERASWGIRSVSARRKLQQREVLRYSIFLPFAGWIILGVLYLSQYHAWLIDAKRESLRAQGEIIAAAIAANVSVETGRMVLDPEQPPELEGPWTPFRDDAIDALHLSLVPERLTPILRSWYRRWTHAHGFIGATER